MEKRYIYWFNELGIKDVPKVGGKNASLGEMYSKLTQKGVMVPNGFAITADAYFHLLEYHNAKKGIKDILKNLDTRNIIQLAAKGEQVRRLVKSLEFPENLKIQILNAYEQLCKQEKRIVDVAVRSSATAEDLPDASFAGQQETYLNVRGGEDLLHYCKLCFASLFTNRAISYRVDKGFDHFSVGLSIGVQLMVRSDLASSGVIFSIDTETGFKNAVFITGSYGLGENIVQGKVNPDEFYVFKPTLDKYSSIIYRKLGNKEIKMVYSDGGNKLTKNVNVPKREVYKYILTDKEILQLAKWAVIIENHYNKPMDIEWAKDGKSNKLYVVQARPETIHANRDYSVIEKYTLLGKGKILTKGNAVGDKIATGKAMIISSAKEIKKFKKGAILVTEMTDPDWEPIMKNASAIITEMGGRTSHAAIVSRELGLPAIVGTNNAMDKIKNNQTVTVDCSSGSDGFVYQGKLKYKKEIINLKEIPKIKTKLMINLGTPMQAFEKSFLPVNGVGLAREEFIINSYIKVHPKALLNYNKIKDRKIKAKIDELTKGYEDKKEFFIDKLAEGVAMIAAAFYPREVILRFSDFKTNEYANLIGGHEYEPKEDNPMLGWRGASRYYDEKYSDAFALECKAVLKAREKFGLKNLVVMIPFCRTVEEGKNVLRELKKNGLMRGRNGLKVYIMCEIPSNVILCRQFLEIFDGFSIGSNDLTQLIMGIDRDSELVAHIYDERNDAVKIMIKQAVDIANKMGKYSGFCGQAPSDYPEMAKFLSDINIQSISLNPDTVIKTLLYISEHEKKKR